MFIKKTLKIQEKLKELEIFHENEIYIYISWYNKFAGFRWKHADVSRTQRVCHAIHIIFWIFSRQGITVPSFIILGYVSQILERGIFLLPPIREQPQKWPSWIRLRPLIHYSWIFIEYQPRTIEDHHCLLKRSRDLGPWLKYFGSSSKWFVGFRTYDTRYLHLLSNIELK